MCAKLPCVPNNLTFLSGSDHAEYTKSRLTEDENKHHENNKGLCGHTGKEWRPKAQ